MPWIFVFRDPVEVMVSNLKSLAQGPCVRIPRQEAVKMKNAEKAAQAANVARQGEGLEAGEREGEDAPRRALRHSEWLRGEHPRGRRSLRPARDLDEGYRGRSSQRWSASDAEAQDWMGAFDEGDDSSYDSHGGEWSWEGEVGDGAPSRSALPGPGLNETEGVMAGGGGVWVLGEASQRRGLLGGAGRGRGMNKPGLTKEMCKECADWLQVSGVVEVLKSGLSRPCRPS